MAARRNGKLSAIFKSGKGFTLTEMIVVLVVLAILAASLVGSASSYIRHSTITKNDNSAKTVYQAAQTSLQQMEKSGSFYEKSNEIIYSNEWIKDLVKDGTEYAYEDANLPDYLQNNENIKNYFKKLFKSNIFEKFDASSATANKSVHMRFVLNYAQGNPDGVQSTLVKRLLQPYFNDTTIFTGAMTIEFDVEKSADSYGKLHCSAKCLSVFYDSRAVSGMNIPEGNTVPQRNEADRYKSLIGYYDGYKGTIVDSVYLPRVQQGIVIKKLMNELSTELLEIKNDADEVIEKKEVTHGWIAWASTLDTINLNGNKKDVYYRLELLNGNSLEKVLILNEDFLLSDDVVGNGKHSIDYSSLAGLENNYEWAAHPQNPKVTVDEYPVVYNSDSDSNRFTRTIKRTSITVNARVYVKTLDNDGYQGASSTEITSNTNSHILPLKITYVENEYNNDKSQKPPYIEYSLDITEFMNENNEINKASITIYPNYFSHETMKTINDETGIIPFKKGKATDLDSLPPPKDIPLTDTNSEP